MATNLASLSQTGWHYDPDNTRVDFYYQGTRGGHINASGASFTGTVSITGILTASAGIVACGATGAFQIDCLPTSACCLNTGELFTSVSCCLKTMQVA